MLWGREVEASRKIEDRNGGQAKKKEDRELGRETKSFETLRSLGQLRVPGTCTPASRPFAPTHTTTTYQCLLKVP